MAFIDWNDSLFTGIDEIDQDHRHLVMLLNRAYEDVINKGSLTSTGAILEELYDYATYHFHREEERMAAMEYPQAAEHLTEHRRFIRRVTEMHKDYLQGRGTVALEMVTFLKNWLVDHISRVDARLGEFAARTNSGGFDLRL